ncbi:MAG: gliding motility lipoprotein GldD [Salinivirgaceae bacterium]
MRRKSYIIVAAVLMLFLGCSDENIPKPKGYIRFDLPEHTYKQLSDDCPYEFELGEYTKIEDRSRSGECWKNIYIKPTRAKIHLSYKKIDNNLSQLLDDAHHLVYGHTVKADAIDEQMFINPVKKVYGVLFTIKGDAASNLQFYATDSTNHYLRGALYFNAAPNEDSLAPLIQFVRKDVEHMIETLNWK